jgi:hypothetical protein
VILPSQLAIPTTEETGYFEASQRKLADWLCRTLGADWSQRPIEGRSLAEVVESFLPPRSPAAELRHLLLAVDGWTALLNDSPLGTDLGVLPSRAARTVTCRAIRAVAAREADGRYGATILEVYEPGVPDALGARRTIFAANDGGTWRFGEHGEPFAFEDVHAYGRPRIAERFTGAMLERYLVELGVPVESEPDVSSAIVVEHGRH